MSPIFGLTDRTQGAFKEIGRLRKGAPKAEGLKDLKYFRPDFRDEESVALARFLETYGDKPTQINIRLAFPDIDRVWQCWFACYNKHGMLARAGNVPGRKGWWFHYLRHNRTGELLVKDGVPEKEFNPKIPIYSYKSKEGKDVPVYARPEGRLSFMIPELAMINYVTLITHSWYDCAKIEDQLHAIKEMAERVGMSLPLVPLVLTRRPETVSISFDGHKKMDEKWIINLDIRQDWGEKQFLFIDNILPGAALPAPQILPELPAGVLDEEWGAGPEFSPDPDDQPEWPPEDEQGPLIEASNSVPVNGNGNGNGNGHRPYDPIALKVKLYEAAKTWSGKKATEKQRNLVAMLFAQAFAPAKEADLMRHALQVHLFGIESMKDVADEMILAILNKWLKPKADTGGAYLIDPMALKEIHLAYDAAIFAQGQKPLPGLEESDL